MFIISTPWFQTTVAKFGANFLSKELKTSIDIDKLHITLSSLEIEGLYVKHPELDTLAYIGDLEIDLNDVTLKPNFNLHINRVDLDNVFFALKRDKQNVVNLTFLIDYFSGNSPPEQSVDTTKSSPFNITVDNLNLTNSTFIYYSVYRYYPKPLGMNYNDIRVDYINIHATDVNMNQDQITANITNASLSEKCGFKVDKLVGKASYDDKAIIVKDLYLKTPHSKMGNYYAMRYNTIGDFLEYVDLVEMEGNFINSHVDIKDVIYFAPSLDGTFLEIDVTGRVKGTVTDLKTNHLKIKTGEKTFIEGKFRIKGLPDVDNTVLDLDFKEFTTNKNDLNYIVNSIGFKDFTMPGFINENGVLGYKGIVSGHFDHLLLDGQITTPSGLIVTNIDLNFKDENRILYSGNVDAYAVNLKQFLQNDKLGEATFSFKTQGAGFDIENMNSYFNFKVDYIDYNNYRYKNISFNFYSDNGIINSGLIVDDKNASISLDFDADFTPVDSLHSYKINANVPAIDFRALNLTKDSLFVSTSFYTNFKGNSIPTLIGNIDFNNVMLVSGRDASNIKDVSIKLDRQDSIRSVYVESDILRMSIVGKYRILNLGTILKSILAKYINKWDLIKDYEPINQDVVFYIESKNISLITSLFVPKLTHFENGYIYGSINGLSMRSSIEATVDKIKYENYDLDSLKITQYSTDSICSITLGIDHLMSDSIYFDNISLTNNIANNKINSNFKIRDRDYFIQLDANSEVEFQDTITTLKILPSEISLNRENWVISDNFRVYFNDDNVFIDRFTIKTDSKRLNIEGSISKNDDYPLIASFRNFDLEMLNIVTKKYGAYVQGQATGNISVSSILSTPKISSSILVKDFAINKQVFGHAELSSRWSPETNEILFSSSIINKNVPLMVCNGSISNKVVKNGITATAEINETDLDFIQPFTEGVFSNISGRVSGNINVTGTVFEPDINGFIYLKKAKFKIDYLGTTYTIDDKVSINNSRINFGDFSIVDENNREASAVAGSYIDMSNLENIKIDLGIETKKFQIINLKESQSELFYGSVYTDGNVRVYGNLNNSISIVINAKTSENSKLFIPIDTGTGVGDDELVMFISKNDKAINTIKKIRKETGKSDFKLDLDITITTNTDAEISVLLGESSGGTMWGKGDGVIQLKLSSLGEFQLYGTYSIVQGKYNMSLPGIKKTFIVNPESMIRFNGDPSNAIFNISAYNELRVNLVNLYSDARIQSNTEEMLKKIQVRNTIEISGSITDMRYKFNIKFPDNEMLYQNTFSSYFGNIENTQKQAISLLATDNFTTDATSAAASSSSAIAGSLAGIASSKMSSILNEAVGVENVDLNANVTGTGQAEFEGNLRLLNQRLVINGSVSSGDKENTEGEVSSSNSNTSNVSSDIDVQYLIFPDGTLRLRAYNRSNSTHTMDLTYDSPYMQGLGLIYRKDFDDWREFFYNNNRARRISERQEAEKEAISESQKDSVEVKKEEIEIKDNNSNTNIKE